MIREDSIEKMIERAEKEQKKWDKYYKRFPEPPLNTIEEIMQAIKDGYRPIGPYGKWIKILKYSDFFEYD